MRPRLVIVGLDGADWRIAGPLMDEGRLPHLAALRSRGSWGDLRSETPTLSPLLWTSIATGKPPSEHGIVDFLVRDPRTGRRVPITSTLRKTRALWNIYSEADLTSDIIGWWAAWPAESIKGCMVSDRFAYSLFGYRSRPEDAIGLVHPEALRRDLERLRVTEEQITLRDLQRFVRISKDEMEAARGRADRDPSQAYEDPVNHLVRILASTRTYHAAALHLLRDSPPDVLAVYYQGIDEVCHRFAHYLPPRLSWVDGGAYEKYRDAVTSFYEYQDGLLGELLRTAGDGVTVVVLSDHGFESGSDRPDFPPDLHQKAGAWHRLHGVLVLEGPGIRSGRLEPAGLYDVAPTLLYLAGLPVAADMPGRPILDAVTPAFKAANPLRTVPTFEKGATHPSGALGGVPSVAEVDEEILARLRSLGYAAAAEIGPASGAAGESAPATRTNLINLAASQMVQGDLANAERTARSLVALDADLVEGHALLAEALEKQGRPEEALQEARHGLNLARDTEVGLTARYLGLARRLRRLDEARQFFVRQAQLLPREAGPGLGRGQVQTASGAWKAAESSFLQALEIDPKSAAAVTGLYNVFERGGRAPEVAAAVESAARRNPDSAAHRTLLGSIHAARGDHRTAESELRRALELEPDRDAALAALGDLLLDTGRREEARGTLERAVARRPDLVETGMALGRLYSKMGRFAEAQRKQAEAVRLAPDSPAAHGQLAIVLIMQDRAEQARPHLERALDLDPSLYELRLHLAVLHHEAGRMAECETALKGAIAARPSDPEPHRLLGSLYKEIGRLEEAEAELALARKLSGGP